MRVNLDVTRKVDTKTTHIQIMYIGLFDVFFAPPRKKVFFFCFHFNFFSNFALIATWICCKN